jgi:hypothetical protein
VRRPVLLAALLVSVTACSLPAATPAPAAPLLATRVVEFDPDDAAGAPVAALSDQPIRLEYFAGWYHGAEHPSGPPIPPGADRAYLAVAAGTGCRLPTGVEVRRVGDDLRTTFVGGTDYPECVRPYGPAAVLELAAADVAGVRTVDGRSPVSPTGPGTLTGFQEIGAAHALAAEVGAAAPAEAGAAVRAALDRPVPAGKRAFVFVLLGCANTGAVLLPGWPEITAELTRDGPRPLCTDPISYLATFEVPADGVAPDAVPTVR